MTAKQKNRRHRRDLNTTMAVFPSPENSAAQLDCGPKDKTPCAQLHRNGAAHVFGFCLLSFVGKLFIT